MLAQMSLLARVLPRRRSRRDALPLDDAIRHFPSFDKFYMMAGQASERAAAAAVASAGAPSREAINKARRDLKKTRTQGGRAKAELEALENAVRVAVEKHAHALDMRVNKVERQLALVHETRA